MDIIELGAIGELVGGVAVIASLLYVGLQVRQSNQINRAESVRSFVRDYNTLLYKALDHSDIWRRGCVDFDGLSGEEQSKLHFLLFSQFMLGLGDSIATPDRSDPFARIMDTAAASSLPIPGFRQWWETFRGAPELINPDYTRHIESLAAQPGALDPLEFLPWFSNESNGKEA